MSDPICRFECEVEELDQDLVVSYRLSNRGPGEVGVFNRLATSGLDGLAVYLSDNVYVEVEDEKLVVKKIALPLPEGVQVTVQPIPDVTRLPAGHTLSERITLPLPARVNHPFRLISLLSASPGSSIVADQAVTVDTLQIQVGVFDAQELNFLPASPAAPDAFRVWPPGLAFDRQIVFSCEARLRTPIVVLDYRVVGAQSAGG